jgi:heme a synthase
MADKYSKSLKLFCTFHTFCVGLLILLGALVKSHDAGLSVPDWPGSYGYNMFLFPPALWIDGIFYEHTHRLLASFVGFLTIVLAISIYKYSNDKRLIYAGWLALIIVIFQGLLGGLTVIYGLPAFVSIMHGVIAQTFFLISIYIWFNIHKSSVNIVTTTYSKLTFLSVCSILVLYIQLILGAIVRHLEAGLAIPDFPTMGGQFLPIITESIITKINTTRMSLNLPEVSSLQVLVHLFHRIGAILVLVTIVPLLVQLKRSVKNSINLIVIIYFLLICQIVLGIITVLSGRSPVITSLHVIFGALLLASIFYTFMLSKVKVST